VHRAGGVRGVVERSAVADRPVSVPALSAAARRLQRCRLAGRPYRRRCGTGGSWLPWMAPPRPYGVIPLTTVGDYVRDPASHPRALMAAFDSARQRGRASDLLVEPASFSIRVTGHALSPPPRRLARMLAGDPERHHGLGRGCPTRRVA